MGSHIVTIFIHSHFPAMVIATVHINSTSDISCIAQPVEKCDADLSTEIVARKTYRKKGVLDRTNL